MRFQEKFRWHIKWYLEWQSNGVECPLLQKLPMLCLQMHQYCPLLLSRPIPLPSPHLSPTASTKFTNHAQIQPKEAQTYNMKHINLNGLSKDLELQPPAHSIVQIWYVSSCQSTDNKPCRT
jgi:hypothetical protein